ncbi:MAG: EAL domain-containing protein, partial [Gammaproteobacteria bacterium]|nr:EAL domain-containing protein [Gammaproteobacteria bacterium]
THYEVLIRMLGDEGQLIEPANFIPIAERMGLIQEVDFWVIGAALDWLHNLPAHLSHLAVNINLSTQGLADPALLPLLRDKLRVTGVDARRITFEITETAAIANIGQTRKVVEQIRALGCQFALDDFGAGFNSYNYLKHFPVDYLKIDGIFIVNLVNDPVDQALVKSMIEIAHTLGKKTVAEFVETAEALKLLKEYGVDYAQGHYLGKPQAALVRY